jgi:ferredoxin-NADP reductase
VTAPVIVPRRRLLWQQARVTEVRPEAPGAATLVLEVPDWQGHLPGQHVDLRLTADDGYQAERSYSIASPPEQAALDITVERIDDGEVSPFLVDEVRVGDEIEMRGPIGGYFTWQAADGGPLLLVAGGSGIAPLMAMTRHRAAVMSDVPARMIASARSLDDLLYRSELEELAARGDGFDLNITLTRSTPPGWTGYQRRVDRDLLEQVAWPAAQMPRAFVCGPTGFVEAVAEALVALGHEPGRIKTERFGPTGG